MVSHCLGRPGADSVLLFNDRVPKDERDTTWLQIRMREADVVEAFGIAVFRECHALAKEMREQKPSIRERA